MNKMLATIAILVATGAACAQAQTPPAAAEAPVEARASEEARSLPVTTLTCRSLLQASGDERDLLLAVFHGYVAGKRGDPSMDTVKMSFQTDDIISYCIDKPDARVLDAFTAAQAQ
jgi:HdeA/HdeB family